MNAKPVVAILCFAAGCLTVAVFFTSYGTAQNDASRPPGEDNSPAAKNIRVRYARANLELAMADLNIAQGLNKRISGTYPAHIVQRLQNHAEIAELRLQYELADGKIKTHDIYLKELEGARKLAEIDLANAIAINKLLAGTIGKQEIRRLELVAEIAKLAIVKGRDPANSSSQLTHLQWQLEQIRAELLWLHLRSEYSH